MDDIQKINIDKLIERNPINIENKKIEKILKDKTILITGAGSIGAEICRQIVKYSPKELILVDIYENNLYNVEQEMKDIYPKQRVRTIVASIRDKKRIMSIFEKYRPQIVFHTAAHKHVPLMENNAAEVVKNNVFGTYNVVDSAEVYNVQKFILISTDKAVNPKSIMGATKKLCEMLIQAKNKKSKTVFSAVRFGNVLGSEGSVVPLFIRQIKQGNSVTVTHKDTTRFFMTKSEAVALILQSVVYAKGGEIFILNMGDPIKIYDIAKKLIKLSNKDIPIKIVGLRKGEKLHEELITTDEHLLKTKNKRIFYIQESETDIKEIENKIKILYDVVNKYGNEEEKIKDIIKTVTLD